MGGDIIILLLGALIGASAAWLLASAYAESRRAALTERLQSRDQQAQSLQSAIDSAKSEIARLGSDVQSQSERRAAAEEKNNRIPKLEADLTDAMRQVQSLGSQITDLKTHQSQLRTTMEQERKAYDEKLKLLTDARQALSDAFKALSSDALKSNNQSFLELAKSTLEKFQQGAQSDLTARQQAIDELLKPLKVSLEKVDQQMTQIEVTRASAYASLSEQVKSLGTTQILLQTETANLVKALRAPQVRGRWGEIQLKRVVEMAGMIDHCDFVTQASLSTEDGQLRPDMIVRLPGGKNVVVDAKCPLQAYLDALSAPDETTRLAFLRQHARQVADHNSRLSAKAYWEKLESTPEFVVLFLPGEMFFSAALEQDPSLIEEGIKKSVILATPTTLIALLRAVAYGWRQELVAESAREIKELGMELHRRVVTLTEHFTRLGSGLNNAVDAYNKAMGCVESRVLVTARKLKDLGAGGQKEIEILENIDKKAVSIQSAELGIDNEAESTLHLPVRVVQ